ncbi:MAG: ATPase [marine bacterium B5-7]|nr:MAG: ATPase [marine bacterium B5-7]
MESFQVIENKDFIGRSFEREKLHALGEAGSPGIAVLYGRRRVGKTELLEQTFRARNILKFEGLEGKPERAQMLSVMQDLASYAAQPLLKEVDVQCWKDVFSHIYSHVQHGVWTIYFEEVQWLAEYHDNFISELKFAWDNYFRRNNKLLLILCGSSPSFMINHVMHSKSLYNRSQHEIHLEEFTLSEARQYLGSNYAKRDVMDAYLTVGGIPVYLEQLKQDSSIWLSLCKNAFTKDAFFSKEYQRIFISSMGDDPVYRQVIEFLSKRHHATRNEILAHLKMPSGGRFSALMHDLEMCGFIRKYVPVFSGESSKLVRYCIEDAYLRFYYNFIKPIAGEITRGKYNKIPVTAINQSAYQKWLGFAFERFCRRYTDVIADILKFSAVQYQSGAYYNRSTSQQDSGFQIDLLYDRADNVLTVCEIKYLTGKVPKKVINDFEMKLAHLKTKKEKTIHKVLITAEGAEQSVIEQGYFDRILTLDDFFS